MNKASNELPSGVDPEKKEVRERRSDSATPSEAEGSGRSGGVAEGTARWHSG